MTDSQVRMLRLRAQRLFPPRTQKGPAVARLVAGLCGVQAQYKEAAALAVRARSHGLTAGAVERTLDRERTVVRNWCLRGTLHLVAAEDAVWLLDIVGPVVIARSARRFRQLGLDDNTVARALKVIEGALAGGGPMTRHGLLAGLQAKGIDTSGQRGIHLLHRAGMLGMICMGADVNGESSYVLMSDWIGRGKVPRRLSGEDALSELARRYLEAYGPAAPRDLAAWSGISVKDADGAFRLVGDEIVEVVVAGKTAWMLKRHSSRLRADRGAATVKLLPGFDNYLLGYRDRTLAVAPADARKVNAGGGIVRPVIVVDGRVVATWKSSADRGYGKGGRKESQGKNSRPEDGGVKDGQTKDSRGLSIELRRFEELGDSVMKQVDAEVADIGRFLGKETGLRQ